LEADGRRRVEEENPVEHGELRGVVALDGPSGTGKSSAARRLAARIGARYLDTGAMYRAVTLAVLRAGVDLADAAEVAEVASAAMVVQGTDPDHSTTFLDGDDVGAEIRGPEVTLAVSPVSAVPAVRELLVAEQRRIIAAALDEAGGIVVEGRDIGTAVVPDAPLKVYLTADAEARAQRRVKQDSASGRESTLDATLADVQRRDAYDSSRAVSPLRAAEDAVVLDTTSLDLPGTLAALLELVDAHGLLAQPSGRVRG
jgi:CMP/dCMP kinase